MKFICGVITGQDAATQQLQEDDEDENDDDDTDAGTDTEMDVNLPIGLFRTGRRAPNGFLMRTLHTLESRYHENSRLPVRNQMDELVVTTNLSRQQIKNWWRARGTAGKYVFCGLCQKSLGRLFVDNFVITPLYFIVADRLSPVAIRLQNLSKTERAVYKIRLTNRTHINFDHPKGVIFPDKRVDVRVQIDRNAPMNFCPCCDI